MPDCTAYENSSKSLIMHFFAIACSCGLLAFGLTLSVHAQAMSFLLRQTESESVFE